MDHLIAKLKKIEKQNYRAYQQIKGQYDFTDFDFYIDHVQSDPYAAASRVRAFRKWSLTGLEWLKSTSQSYQIAARDFIARTFVEFAKQENNVSMTLTGQTVMDATSVIFTDEGIELRFRVNLPAEGRSILGKKASNILTFHLPKYIRKATLEREIDIEALKRHCEIIEDQDSLRAQLDEHNLLAFVANGSVLPRIAGNCDLPMKDAITFVSPSSLETTLQRPNLGAVTGMGVPKGVTLIVGGGFHGKSTLLNAIERSIYNHIPNDGRECIVTSTEATKIKAEDGRSIHNLNLSNYINHLPFGKDTSDFSTQDASGSTSQAAWLQESIEAGATAILIDEDTSATNFMIRDERMQALVSKGDEPITPFVDRVGQLRDELDVSTMIVMGGSGDYLDVADTVIQMHDYQALDVTDKAKEVVKLHPSERQNESEKPLELIPPRHIDSAHLLSILADGKFRVSGKGANSLRFGKDTIDLEALEQLESNAELNAIGWLLFQLAQQPGWSEHPPKALVELLEGDWSARMPNSGDLAKPRIVDTLSALNRLRSAKMRQPR
ncbi:isopentenyl-diphosphate delta-isomerase [Vibrio sp. 10N.286.49.C2]|uniref:ABC-ATPase domain-containing protein n=1 Tax=unclassified Vibrio TaxID=2614977 RepID=UPI000C83C1AA|nr:MULTISPECIES: ABC-ATPase domain-containing protein [unclassified Vibrio]PMH34770.1 isopentenyl-diphosphate delta-isomerase [Vibrio sp. 10N.286.49.C2]PMH51441.1 isopentenyl-diphosphate delta-isomerase [Vibrio sp. 10N.286.49.B1]PMH79363.1 isopentenyl-diphosphate delta-isomerase [Vibrio sp. 10N.286.48.B7]